MSESLQSSKSSDETWSGRITDSNKPSVGKGIGKKGNKTLTQIQIQDTENRLASLKKELENPVKNN